MVKSKVRAPMPSARRAKQFAPFDALKGLKEAIAAREKRTEPKRELTEEMVTEIDEMLSALQKGQRVTVIYYVSVEQEYLQITGTVKKVDSYWGLLQVDHVAIDFAEIYRIIT